MADTGDTARHGIGFGVALAMCISYVAYESVAWAIIHGILNWFYVIYALIWGPASFW